jgi:hypothetical protein
MAVRILAVIERRLPPPARDGADDVPRQVQDLLHFCVGLRVQFGSVDVVLRGSAAACALGEPKSLPDALRYLRALVRTGARVWADDADLRELGYANAPLLDGVAVTDTDALAATWHEYEEVWCL